MGGYSTYAYPDDIGYPVEGGTWLKLEIHYNTARAPFPDIEDKSGFRIRYGPPRAKEAGVIMFGWVPSSAFVIPQGILVLSLIRISSTF